MSLHDLSLAISELLDEQTRLTDAGRKADADALQPRLYELLDQRSKLQ